MEHMINIRFCNFNKTGLSGQEKASAFFTILDKDRIETGLPGFMRKMIMTGYFG